MAEFQYSGTELELFAHATNWKNYWKRSLAPYLRGDVLEVGAGIGENTRLLAAGRSGRWVCLEPDRALLDVAAQALAQAGLAQRCELVCGTLDTWAAGREFDTVVYLDVLEHIADDRAELVRAARALRGGGRIVVLAPAHQALYGEFDRAVGHVRRYDKRSLAAAGSSGLELERMFYLDSVGLLASLANRFVLHQSLPTLAQIKTWDRLLVPLSRALDPLLLRSLGKSLVGVWRWSGEVAQASEADSGTAAAARMP